MDARRCESSRKRRRVAHVLMQSRAVRIICPECGKVCDTRVELWAGDPWPTYIHDCEHCGYVIMESEWDEEVE